MNPVVIGDGQPLFKGLTQRLFLKLEKTQTFRSGGWLVTNTPAIR